MVCWLLKLLENCSGRFHWVEGFQTVSVLLAFGCKALCAPEKMEQAVGNLWRRPGMLELATPGTVMWSAFLLLVGCLHCCEYP